MSNKTPKQLMNDAMSMGQPERVPTMCQLAIGHTLLQSGIHGVDYFLSNEAYTEGLLKMRELYDFDGILLHKPGRDPEFGGLIDRIDRDADEPTIYLKDGRRVECMRDDDPYYRTDGDKIHPEISSLNPNDPFDWAGDSFMHWCYHKGSYPCTDPDGFPDHYFEAIDLINKKVGDEFSVHGEVRAPMDHYFMAGGIEEALMALLLDPEQVHKLMEYFARMSTAWAIAQVRRGCHAIKISSPFVGAGFLSRDMYEEWVVPYERQIARAVKDEGAFVYTHTCGAIGDRLDLMVQTEISGIETLDPPPLGTVNLDEAKEQLKDKLFIKGNIDPVNGLLRNDYENAREVVESVYKTGSQGGQYILSSACSVAPPTAAENVQLLAKTVRKYAS